MAQRIKKGDTVVVITGEDKGKSGRVKRVLVADGKVIVEGINRVLKHVKKSQRFPDGGRLQMEAAIHISNVQPFDTEAKVGTRVRFEDRDGKKHRVSVKSGSSLGLA